jgi:hypothetical protein
MTDRVCEVTRFDFAADPDTWYEAHISTAAVSGPVADGEGVYTVEIKFVVTAKIQNGHRSPPEGSIAKTVIMTDDRLIPCQSEMKQLLTLLADPLPGAGRIDWQRLRFRRILVRFGPRPTSADRNPVVAFRLPPGPDGKGGGDSLEPGPVAPPAPLHPEGSGSKGEHQVAPLPPGGGTHLAGRGAWLYGWKEIREALGLPREKERILRQLNEKQKGPIRRLGRGRPPEVFENELRAWWDDVEGRHEAYQRARATEEEALEKLQQSRRLSLKDGRTRGRRGEIVFPEVSMHVKKRRSDSQSRSSEND